MNLVGIYFNNRNWPAYHEGRPELGAEFVSADAGFVRTSDAFVPR